MKAYKYLEHTADVEYIAYGRDINECFKNALLAMFDTMSYTPKVRSSKSKGAVIVVKDSAKSMEDMLWYTLQDALSIMDSKSLFGYRVSSIAVAEEKGSFTVHARIYAKEREDSTSKLDVKGVARYNLKVERKNGLFGARVVLDV